MSKKCVHKGCGKAYEADDEECVYHPGPPVFHEGQKGWKCCKPRVLTFDEFLAIPPCTTGTHSQVDDTPAPEPAKAPDVPNDTQVTLGSLQESLPAAPPRLPAAQAATARPEVANAPQQVESEDDEPGVQVTAGATCKRKGCGQTSKGGERSADEQCVHHPGAPIFHEGSKGWSCCKRRVLEFDQFMNIEGCKTKDRHLFVGRQKKDDGAEEKVNNVRHDFYQTSTTLTLSLYLKKTLPPPKSSISFTPTTLSLSLHTADRKAYVADIPLYAAIDPENCTFRVLGTKVEVTLRKEGGGRGWPVLGRDEKGATGGEILQVGRAGMA